MDGLVACCVGRYFPHNSVKVRRLYRGNVFMVNSSRSEGDFSADGRKLDNWDKMELKFGRLLGEDPKLTLAKILQRKSNPDASYLDIEKSFLRNKGKQDKDIDYGLLLELEKGSLSDPTDVSIKNKKMNTNINLVRPIMKKRDVDDLPSQNPNLNKQVGLHSSQIVDSEDHLPSTSLRKPSKPKPFEIHIDKTSKIQIKPNIFLKMRKEPKLESVDVLVKKPERISLSLGFDKGVTVSSGPSTSDCIPENIKESDGGLEIDSYNSYVEESIQIGLTGVSNKETEGVESDYSYATGKGELLPSTSNLEDFLKVRNQLSEASVQDEELMTEVQSVEKRPNDSSYMGNVPEVVKSLSPDHPIQAALLGKPQRLDSSLRKQMPFQSQVGDDFKENLNDIVESNFVSKSVEKHEVNDWEKAEALLNSGERVEVELISCSSRGFVVSFGSLIGFLPYRKLSGRWKFLSFESWLRKKGLEKSSHNHGLEIEENGAADNNCKDKLDAEIGDKVAPNVELNGLLDAYDQEKLKYLSSFVGQKIKISVIQADRNSRRLVFSGKPKENEELSGKKKALMAKLNIGHVVKCCITKITYFGIFVEVEGVPALIHHSEVSWDATLDPTSCFTIGQIVDAKVHHLDFSLERISLSLKQVMPDPLLETLESVVDVYDSSNGNLDLRLSDVEWSDVEQLIEELKKIDGIENVTKGRFFLTPGLAPTFQVYMASMIDNQYKLLARSENKVQEVMVQASLDKEQMKSAILTCTGRVQ